MARKPFVMLVDDDRAMAEMYGLGLDRDGFRVKLLHDADALFEALQQATPDLLVLDWELPGRTGGEVIEELRRNRRTADIPIFILSSHPGSAVEAGLVGARAWLEKPRTMPGQLAEKLAAALPDAREKAG